MEKRHRIFVAINLPADIKKELSNFQKKFAPSPQARGGWARWTSKDNLHITLEFLGNLTDQEIGEVCMTVKAVAERHNSFDLNITSICYGPNKGSASLSGVKETLSVPKFVWAEGEKSDQLSALREDLESSLTERVRFAPENQAGYLLGRPHITLAKISSWEFKAIDPEEVPEINEAIDLMFTVESIDVMESEMKRDGPVYTILESHQLK